MSAISTLDKIKCLQKVVLFARCKMEQLLELGAIAHEVDFKKGDIIFRENDPGDSLYCLVAGKVRLQKSGTSYEAIIGEGQTFDTLAILDRKPRAITAVAETDGVALRIDTEEFYNLLADHIEIVEGIFAHLAQELRTCLNTHSGYEAHVEQHAA
jgi:CRP-like cAMP-binding protein